MVEQRRRQPTRVAGVGVTASRRERQRRAANVDDGRQSPEGAGGRGKGDAFPLSAISLAKEETTMGCAARRRRVGLRRGPRAPASRAAMAELAGTSRRVSLPI